MGFWIFPIYCFLDLPLVNYISEVAFCLYVFSYFLSFFKFNFRGDVFKLSMMGCFFESFIFGSWD